MPTQQAKAVWNGDLKTGSGKMKLGSGICEVDFSFASRFENGDQTNPEELIGAAHAGCYSMALSKELAEAGYEPRSIETTAKVTFEVIDHKPAITSIILKSKAAIPEIDEEAFQNAGSGCHKRLPGFQGAGRYQHRIGRCADLTRSPGPERVALQGKRVGMLNYSATSLSPIFSLNITAFNSLLSSPCKPLACTLAVSPHTV